MNNMSDNGIQVMKDCKKRILYMGHIILTYGKSKVIREIMSDEKTRKLERRVYCLWLINLNWNLCGTVSRL